MNSSEVDRQRAYYATAASRYDREHVCEDKIHALALSFLESMTCFYGFESLLDVGSGTGRVLDYFREQRPSVHTVGIEPVAEMRAVGHAKGLPESQLQAGDATQLQFPDASFDVVCCFGVLHHIKQPERAVAEMLRVARRAIFISDGNNFGQGSTRARRVKQALDFLRLWPVANLVKTRGKGYMWSESDGVAYSYSVFNNYEQVRAACRQVHLLNTEGTGINPYRTAGHVALLGIKG